MFIFIYLTFSGPLGGTPHPSPPKKNKQTNYTQTDRLPPSFFPPKPNLY